MKKTIYVIFIISLFLLLCGCTQRQIVSIPDELTAYSWEKSDKFGKEIKLSFEENCATLTIKSPDKSYKIQGNAIIDNDSIQIFDDSLKSTFSFKYNLYGDKIKLKYNDNTIELDKSAVQSK
ncbi:hypothetical protein ACTQ3M_09785 [Oscillospiraceae bacterium LCP25S3_E10]|nr:hypothetical protein [Ruminococcus sp.]